MADGKFVAYYRVSTARQGASGLGLDAQRAAVLAYLNGAGWTLLGEFTEIESGKRDKRPQLALAMDRCRLTGATLVIAKMDRLSRNMAFTANLMDSGVDFVACDNPHATRFTIHILAAVAEHEGKQISARTKAAMQQAKARMAVEGKTLGGYRGGPVPASTAGVAGKQAKAKSFAALVAPTLTGMKSRGLSLNAMAAELTGQGIKTSQGGAWTATAVRRAMARA